MVSRGIIWYQHSKMSSIIRRSDMEWYIVVSFDISTVWCHLIHGAVGYRRVSRAIIWYQHSMMSSNIRRSDSKGYPVVSFDTSTVTSSNIRRSDVKWYPVVLFDISIVWCHLIHEAVGYQMVSRGIIWYQHSMMSSNIRRSDVKWYPEVIFDISTVWCHLIRGGRISNGLPWYHLISAQYDVI